MSQFLKGNFEPKSFSGHHIPSFPQEELHGVDAEVFEFEKRAREHIGGSLSFVSKLKDRTKPLFYWDEFGI